MKTLKDQWLYEDTQLEEVQQEKTNAEKLMEAFERLNKLCDERLEAIRVRKNKERQ